MIPSSKIAYRVLKQGFKPLFWRYKLLPRVNIPPLPRSRRKRGSDPFKCCLHSVDPLAVPWPTEVWNVTIGEYIPCSVTPLYIKVYLMYRGKNPSRYSAGHFVPLKITDDIKKSMGQNDPLIFSLQSSAVGVARGATPIIAPIKWSKWPLDKPVEKWGGTFGPTPEFNQF